MFGFPIVVGLVMALLFSLVFRSDTPKFLLKSGRVDEGKKVLAKIYGDDNAEEALVAFLPADSAAMRSPSGENDEPAVQGGQLKDVCKAEYRRAFLVGCFLSLFQQFCGINAVIFYSSTIFSSTGGDDDKEDRGAQIGTALVGVVNVVSTVIAIWLLKWFGRRTLLIWGQINMAVCQGLIGMFFQLGNDLAIKIMTLAFVTFFGFSSGPIAWLYNAEIMTEAGMSIATFINWVVTILISLLTPTMINEWPKEAATFYMYAGFCLLGLVFVLIWVKETKGKTAKEIRQMFSPTSGASFSGAHLGTPYPRD